MDLREIYQKYRPGPGQVGQVRQAGQEPEVSAPYFLAEILSLHRLSQDERREIHRAKLAYGDVRLWQDG
jgi:hypothetical protein